MIMNVEEKVMEFSFLSGVMGRDSTKRVGGILHNFCRPQRLAKAYAKLHTCEFHWFIACFSACLTSYGANTFLPNPFFSSYLSHVPFFFL